MGALPRGTALRAGAAVAEHDCRKRSARAPGAESPGRTLDADEEGAHRERPDQREQQRRAAADQPPHDADYTNATQGVAFARHVPYFGD